MKKYRVYHIENYSWRGPFIEIYKCDDHTATVVYSSYTSTIKGSIRDLGTLRTAIEFMQAHPFYNSSVIETDDITEIIAKYPEIVM